MIDLILYFCYNTGERLIKKGDKKMKSTGIVRKVDELGRIVIPKELRRKYGIETKDGLEIYVEDDRIILKKYEPSCIFCQNSDDLIDYHGRNICPECAAKIGSHVG